MAKETKYSKNNMELWLRNWKKEPEVVANLPIGNKGSAPVCSGTQN
jgi:hypothetical protein